MFSSIPHCCHVSETPPTICDSTVYQALQNGENLNIYARARVCLCNFKDDEINR